MKRTGLLLLGCSCLTLLLGGCFQPDPQEESNRQALEDFNELQQRAAQGIAAFQYQLGEVYAFQRVSQLLISSYKYGEVAPTDYELAAQWFRQAATKGHLEAQFRLGELLIRGEPGLTAEQARRHFETTSQAAQGTWVTNIMNSQPPIPYRGVDANPQEAFQWLSKAAERGHPKAQVKLAEMLEYGWAGQERDLLSAYMWASVAARTSTDAREALERLESKLPRDQRLEAQRRAEAFVPKK